VENNEKAIDGILREYSEHWSVERMSRIDRTILRVAIFEILWCADIPPNVSINEAIELGKKFSTDKSALFINGVLDKVTHSREE
jgi:N utilization substance protein B